MAESAPPIPEQIIFEFTRGGARQAGVKATCAPEATGELWTISVADLHAGNPTVGCRIVPHGGTGTDARVRTITAVSTDGKSWLCTCTVA
jgi:hypothetical protein